MQCRLFVDETIHFVFSCLGLLKAGLGKHENQVDIINARTSIDRHTLDVLLISAVTFSERVVAYKWL